MATVTPIGAVGSGRIGTATDVDVFSFTLAEDGQYTTVAASPAPVGPNLDLRVSLLDAGGTVVLESDPPSSMVSAGVASGLDTSVAATLPAGTCQPGPLNAAESIPFGASGSPEVRRASA